MAASWCAKKDVGLYAVTRSKLIRRLPQLLWWTGMTVHLFWVPSEMMPADGISRIGPVSIVIVIDVTQNRWSDIMTFVC